MKKPKTKICIGCHTLFQARRDAKTCSSKCRKRYQRARELYISTNVEMSQIIRGQMSHIKIEVAATPTEVSYAA